jgi:hypothetical protein
MALETALGAGYVYVVSYPVVPPSVERYSANRCLFSRDPNGPRYTHKLEAGEILRFFWSCSEAFILSQHLD